MTNKKRLVVLLVLLNALVIINLFQSGTRLFNYDLGDLTNFFIAVITLLTLLEIKQQRKESYVPRVAFEYDSIVSYWQAFSGNNYLPWPWLNGKANKKLIDMSLYEYLKSRGDEVGNLKKPSFEPDDYFKVRLANLGNGAAVKVSVRWEIDTVAFENFINEIAETATIEYMKPESLGNRRKRLSVKLQCGQYLSISYGGEDEEKLEYLLPIKDENLPVYIELSHTFQQLVAMLAALSLHNTIDCFHKVMTFVNNREFKVIVRYSDIGGNEYVNTHRFKVHISSLSAKPGNDIRMYEQCFFAKMVEILG